MATQKPEKELSRDEVLTRMLKTKPAPQKKEAEAVPANKRKLPKRRPQR